MSKGRRQLHHRGLGVLILALSCVFCEASGPAQDKPSPAEQGDAAGPAQSAQSPGDASTSPSPDEGLPSLAQYASKDHSYETLLHWRNRRKWGTSPSLGNGTHGKLPGGQALELKGPHHLILPMCQERGTNFGTPRLLELSRYAAKKVQEGMPGPRLMVCNMSIEGGGPMRWSRSHTAGRDVDFGFFMKKDGVPTEPSRGLLTFEKGLERVFNESTYTFDVPRNWLLIKTLLTHPTIEVQWVFIANHLRRALFKHAAGLGEPLDLMIRARQIVRQPMDSTPHNDHIHARIYCDPGERIHGCRDKEPFWPWTQLRDARLTRRAAALSLGLRDKSQEMRKLAFERIESRRLYDAAPALVEVALMGPDEDLQARAIELVVEWGQRRAEIAYALGVFLRGEGGGFKGQDTSLKSAESAVPISSLGVEHLPWIIGEGRKRRPGHIRRAYIILGRLGATETAPLLAAALGSRRLVENGGSGLPEALLAARAARHVMSTKLVPALVQLLDHPNLETREAALLALERITNHSVGGSIGKGAAQAQLRAFSQKWRQWWRDHGSLKRQDLLQRGFERVGVVLEGWPSVQNVPALVRSMKHPDPTAYNADRALSWLTARRSVLDASSERKQARWKEWSGVGD